MEMQHYIRALRARWRRSSSTFVPTVPAALGASLLTTPLYAASTQLFVSTTGTCDAANASPKARCPTSGTRRSPNRTTR